MKKTLIICVVLSVLCIGAALWIMGYAGGFLAIQEGKPSMALAVISDSIFVPGGLVACFGALMWLAGEGVFDGLSYAGHVALHAFIPMPKRKAKQYADYKAEKQERRKHFPKSIFFVGLSFVIIAIIIAVIQQIFFPA